MPPGRCRHTWSESGLTLLKYEHGRQAPLVRSCWIAEATLATLPDAEFRCHRSDPDGGLLRANCQPNRLQIDLARGAQQSFDDIPRPTARNLDLARLDSPTISTRFSRPGLADRPGI